jgi:hypothetical protein
MENFQVGDWGIINGKYDDRINQFKVMHVLMKWTTLET